MISYAIVSTQQERRAFVTQNLAGCMHDIITGGGRVYILSLVRHPESEKASDLTFSDPLDGELLVSINHFATERDARAWVAADIALHAAQTRGVH